MDEKIENSFCEDLSYTPPNNDSGCARCGRFFNIFEIFSWNVLWYLVYSSVYFGIYFIGLGIIFYFNKFSVYFTHLITWQGCNYLYFWNYEQSLMIILLEEDVKSQKSLPHHRLNVYFWRIGHTCLVGSTHTILWFANQWRTTHVMVLSSILGFKMDR